MKALILLMMTALMTRMAAADQFKTVTVKHGDHNYDFEIRYPLFFANSVPAFAVINSQILKTLSTGCDVSGTVPPQGYSYRALASVAALNDNYVSVRVDEDLDCGGAHPNAGWFYLTYDSKTGQELNIEKEFGFLSVDDPNWDMNQDQAQRAKIAEILVDRIPADVASEGCFTGSRAHRLELLNDFFPVVMGLAKGKKVVLGISPPHVAEACQFDVRVDESVVRKLIVPGSYLLDWLK